MPSSSQYPLHLLLTVLTLSSFARVGLGKNHTSGIQSQGLRGPSFSLPLKANISIAPAHAPKGKLCSHNLWGCGWPDRARSCPSSASPVITPWFVRAFCIHRTSTNWCDSCLKVGSSLFLFSFIIMLFRCIFQPCVHYAFYDSSPEWYRLLQPKAHLERVTAQEVNSSVH